MYVINFIFLVVGFVAGWFTNRSDKPSATTEKPQDGGGGGPIEPK